MKFINKITKFSSKIFLSNQAVILATIILIAFFLHLIGITQYPLNGDEYRSIHEASQVGLNWTSIEYSLLLNAWSRISTSDFWLRCLAALFSLGTIPCVYMIVMCITGERKAAIYAGLLAATSPFVFYHAQEVRFYTLFIFTSSLFISISLCYWTKGRKASWIPWIIISGLLLIFSHYLGIVVLTVQLLVLWTASTNTRTRWSRIGITAILLTICFTFPLIPRLQTILWQIYEKLTAGNYPASPVTTHISILSLVKLGMAGYVFLFGYHVYPLDLLFVVPALVIFGFVLLAGSWYLVKSSQWSGLPVLFILSLVYIYLLIDSIGGRLASGVAPRHVAFFCIIILLLTAVGLTRLPKSLAYSAFAGLLIININAIIFRWQNQWSYGDLIDFRKAAEFYAQNSRKEDLLIMDGRSSDAVKRYFSNSSNQRPIWEFNKTSIVNELASYDRIVFITNDYQTERRKEFNQFIRMIEKEFDSIIGYVDYPLYQYVFKRKPQGISGYAIYEDTGQVHNPLSIKGLEFQDLNLPIALNYYGSTINIIGATILPDLTEQAKISIHLSNTKEAKKIIIVSSAYDVEKIRDGEKVMDISLVSENGITKSFPLQYGIDILSWNDFCTKTTNCETIYQWHKRLAILGHGAYPEAWNDFMAGMHATSLEIKQNLIISQVDITWLSENGKIAIWAILLQ